MNKTIENVNYILSYTKIKIEENLEEAKNKLKAFESTDSFITGSYDLAYYDILKKEVLENEAVYNYYSDQFDLLVANSYPAINKMLVDSCFDRKQEVKVDNKPIEFNTPIVEDAININVDDKVEEKRDSIRESILNEVKLEDDMIDSSYLEGFSNINLEEVPLYNEPEEETLIDKIVNDEDIVIKNITVDSGDLDNGSYYYEAVEYEAPGKEVTRIESEIKQEESDDIDAFLNEMKDKMLQDDFLSIYEEF